jgi:Na+-transporting methylmalonyl-CoA/oxaloacetate decarboxylase gamma subunit
MDFTSRLKWIIVAFVLLFVLVFVGWGLSAIARSIFNTGSSTPTVQVEGINVEDVDTVRFIVEGPIVASNDHHSYVIEATSNVVSMTVYSNYGHTVFRQKSYVNNAEAYDSLVQALEKANVTSRIKNTDTEDDFNEKGACPAGRRYIIELGDEERRWSTSCPTIKGTAGGNMITIRSLFNKQIPDYNDLVKDTALRN